MTANKYIYAIMKNLIIGIDPDTSHSGYAEWDVKDRKLIYVSRHTFFDIFDILSKLKEQIALVRIEAGWLNEKSNFHARRGQSKTAGERIAKNVGSNHEVGRKIVEMCEYLDIPHETVKPLGTKNIDAKLFKAITGWVKQTNQDSRDAAMLCYEYKLITPHTEIWKKK